MSTSQGLVQDVCVGKGKLCFASMYKTRLHLYYYTIEAHYYSRNHSITPLITDFFIHSSIF